VRIARKLNKLAKSVDWATPVQDDLDKSGKKRRASSRKLAATRKRAAASNHSARPHRPAAKKKTRK
jgi:hypothetical protein